MKTANALSQPTSRGGSDGATEQLAPAPRSWLLPHEHGAYVQLGVPLFTALVLSRAAFAGVLLAAAAVLLFAAHEPVLILLGQRGARIQTRDGAAAKVALVCRGAGAALLILAGMLVGGKPVIAALVVPAVLGAVLGVLVWRKREKTTLGEVLAPFATSAWAVPILIAGHVEARRALGVAAVMALALAAPVFGIRAVIFGNKPRAKRSRVRVRALAGLAGCAAAGVAVALGTSLGILASVAGLPLATAAVVYVALLPSPRLLQKLGWIMATAGLALPALLIAAVL